MTNMTNEKWIEVSQGHYLLEGGVTLFQCQFHVEAIEVTSCDDGEQHPVEPDEQGTYDSLQSLCNYGGGSGPLETIEISGQECVVYLTPYSR